MKYIRTKDGIYENKPLEKHLGKRKGNGFEIVFKEQDIIKQADTIEELIDEYVTIDSKFDYKQLKRKPSICDIYEIGDEKFVYWNDYSKEPLLKEVLKETNVYGAIWTDKGLIYVAKMNEKGELELL